MNIIKIEYTIAYLLKYSFLFKMKEALITSLFWKNEKSSHIKHLPLVSLFFSFWQYLLYKASLDVSLNRFFQSHKSSFPFYVCFLSDEASWICIAIYEFVLSFHTTRYIYWLRSQSKYLPLLPFSLYSDWSFGASSGVYATSYGSFVCITSCCAANTLCTSWVISIWTEVWREEATPINEAHCLRSCTSRIKTVQNQSRRSLLRTLQGQQYYVMNSVIFKYSNGPQMAILEGVYSLTDTWYSKPLPRFHNVHATHASSEWCSGV